MNSRTRVWMSLLAGMLSCWLPLTAGAATAVVVPMATARPLKNVVTVSAQNGKFTDPVAAMNSITDASAANPYLLLIGPGQYTLTGPLIMKPYVNVTGSGMQVTWLVGAISSSTAGVTSAIVKTANNACLSNLSVSNTGGGNVSVGVFSDQVNLTARLEQLSVYAKGGDVNIGVMNNTGSSPIITGVNIAVQGESAQSSIGLYNLSSSSPTVIGLNLLVWGGSTDVGIVNVAASSPVIDRANIYVYGGVTNIGIRNSASNEVKIRRSTVSGTTEGLSNIGGSTNTRVSQSTLINGASGGGYTCVASDDGQGHFLWQATCEP